MFSMTTRWPKVSVKRAASMRPMNVDGTAGRKRDRQGEGRYPMPPPEAPTRGADDLMPHRGMMRKSAAQHPSAATDQEEFP
jgi:hypothetical protein